jgi:hypothetical protein
MQNIRIRKTEQQDKYLEVGVGQLGDRIKILGGQPGDRTDPVCRHPEAARWKIFPQRRLIGEGDERALLPLNKSREAFKNQPAK